MLLLKEEGAHNVMVSPEQFFLSPEQHLSFLFVLHYQTEVDTVARDELVLDIIANANSSTKGDYLVL